jgi:hypothetical protein
MEPCLACHQHACECFGGMPHTVMVANRKAAVRQRARGAAPVCNPMSLDFATPNGFPIAPCHVGKGHAKGQGENGGGDVKKHCLADLELPDCSARNPAARQGLDTVAKVRVQGATQDTPLALWQTERPRLRPLPLQPCASATVSQVRASRPFRMTRDTKRSAVPAPYAGPPLTLKTSPDRLCLYHGDTLMARQARRSARCQAVEAPEHPKPLLEQRQKGRDHRLFLRCLALSPRGSV